MSTDDKRNALHTALYAGEFRPYSAENEKRFREAAIDACGLSGHPKADKAYSLAWARGHSSGYEEVLIELDELADLLLL